MVNIKIDNQAINVKEDLTILEAAKTAGIEIPTLCYLKGLCEAGACRVCVVSIPLSPTTKTDMDSRLNMVSYSMVSTDISTLSILI